MRLYRFAQTRQGEVPLAGQPVTPASGFDFCPQLLRKSANHIGFVAGGEQVKIISQIGPMIQGLHHHYWTIGFFQRVRYTVQIAEGMDNALPLGGEYSNGPRLDICVATVSSNPVDDFKNAYHYVIGVSQLDKIPPLFTGEE